MTKNFTQLSYQRQTQWVKKCVCKLINKRPLYISPPSLTHVTGAAVLLSAAQYLTLINEISTFLSH